ncbi:MAG TPA: hypothetical protein EYH24_04845 [Thermococcus paralvinellae]|uniref:Uncharacterized protein n=1 Tax=Thermococcus paralvinellae TaxID=582419 RepID=A0A832ZMJ7_9EURY|nr:hypothetical protein [Thermococcus paralvinellae]
MACAAEIGEPETVMPRWTGLLSEWTVVVIYGQVSKQLFQSTYKWLQLHQDIAQIVVLVILLFILLILVYNLFRESLEAFVLYLLVVSMTIIWFFNSDEFVIRFKSIHLALLLLFSCLMFYLAPKLSRELGFLIYGLAFASPTFRDVVKTLDRDFLSLIFFVATLALIMNLSFAPTSFRADFEVALLSIFTLVTVGLSFYALAIPLAFVLTFPKRHKRNFIYVMLTLTGVIAFWKIFGIGITVEFPHTHTNYIMGMFVKETLIQLILIVYFFTTNFKTAIGERGQVLFLQVLALMYFPLLTVNPVIFTPLVIVISALSIRLTQKI